MPTASAVQPPPRATATTRKAVGITTVMVATVSLLRCPSAVMAINAGYGVASPPMGWRDWNQFLCDGHANPGNASSTDLNQSLIEAMYAGLVDRSRDVDGRPTSLLDVGYRSAGLDDCWQACNSGPDGRGWHDANGNPNVNKARFPDLKAMAKSAHDKGLLAGWYFNNCDCRDSCSSDACFEGDVRAAVDFGFDSLKFDGCGGERNISKWHDLLNTTSPKPVMIENCHNGPNTPLPNLSRAEQPFTFFRTSGDARSTFGSVMTNLQSVRPFTQPEVGPGVWRYADMLMIGVTNTQCPTYCPHGPDGAGPLSHSESRTQLAAWAVVSSPLILGLDLRDHATVSSVWDIVTNREVIAVSQTWAGDNGGLVAEANRTVTLPYCGWDQKPCKQPAWQVWAKAQPNGSTAVVLINVDSKPQTISVAFSAAIARHNLAEGALAEDAHAGAVGGGIGDGGSGGGGGGVAMGGQQRCFVRDLWSKKDLGQFTGEYSAVSVAPHDSAAIMISSCSSFE